MSSPGRSACTQNFCGRVYTNRPSCPAKCGSELAACKLPTAAADSDVVWVQASAVLACQALGFEDGAFLDALDSDIGSGGPLPPWLATEQLDCDSDAQTLAECAGSSFGNTALCGPFQALFCTRGPSMRPVYYDSRSLACHKLLRKLHISSATPCAVQRRYLSRSSLNAIASFVGQLTSTA